MKSHYIIYLFASSVLLATNALANVAQSGKWSESSTWSEGTVPTTSSTTPYTSFIIDNSNTALQIDTANVYVDKITLNESDNTTISIDSGNIFHLTGYTSTDAKTKSIIECSSTTAKNITFSGDGTLALNLSKISDPAIRNSNVVFDVNVSSDTSGGNFFFSDGNSKITINKAFDAKGGQMNFSNATVLLNSNNIKFGFTIATGNTTFSTGSVATLSAGNMSNFTVNGNVTITGVRDYTNERFTLNASNMIVGTEGKLTLSSTDSRARFLLKGISSISSAQDSVNFAGTAYLCNGLTLTLNTSNAIKAKTSTGQGATNFNVINYSTVKNTETTKWEDTFAAANVKIVLGANNDFGSFTFYTGSKLTIDANGFSSSIGSFKLYETGATFDVELQNLTDFTIKLNSLDNVDSYTDDNGLLRAYNITYIDNEEFANDIFLVADKGNGGYWLNTAVPEPSTIASIFGAIALALAAVRRRQK